eukprot:scaffold11532_cov119-Cylindrotheca_fusiformis.AAC.1
MDRQTRCAAAGPPLKESLANFARKSLVQFISMMGWGRGEICCPKDPNGISGLHQDISVKQFGIYDCIRKIP